MTGDVDQHYLSREKVSATEFTEMFQSLGDSVLKAVMPGGSTLYISESEEQYEGVEREVLTFEIRYYRVRGTIEQLADLFEFADNVTQIEEFEEPPSTEFPTDRRETVEYDRRFAQNIPVYLSEEDTKLRLKAAVFDGLSELWEEHGRLDNIEIETDVHRSRIEPQCSYLEVSIEAEPVRWSR